MKNNHTPEIRFPGFTGDWEQRKLGDIGIVAMCKRIFKEQTSENGEIPFFKIGTFGGIPDSFISRELFNEYRSKYSFPDNGDVLISASGTIGRTVIYNGEEAYYQDSNIVWLKCDKERMDNSFLQQFYQIVKWAGIEGSTIKRLYNNNILSTEILFPSIKEQTKIGDFFKQLDKSIALHQQELTTLKQTKQGFLQKMFPKEGKSVPEIRFPGFTGDWEQRKLSDIKDVRDGTHDSPKYYSEGFPLVTSKNLTENGLDMTDVSLISEDDFKSINKRSKVDIGDIIFGMIGTIGNPVIVDREGFAIKNVALIKHGGEVSNEFLIQQLKSPIFGKYILNENVGNTQKFLGLSKVRAYQFLSPSYEEQIKIGNFLKRIDDTIALHQRELDTLKETKKAFLQKMFV